MAKESGGFSGSILKGLTDHSPSATDKSTTLPKGPSVNSDATRSGTAPTQPTLGPRCA